MKLKTTNPEDLKLYRKYYYLINKREINAKAKNYYQKNKKETLLKHKEWRECHKEAIREYNRLPKIKSYHVNYRRKYKISISEYQKNYREKYKKKL